MLGEQLENEALFRHTTVHRTVGGGQQPKICQRRAGPRSPT